MIKRAIKEDCNNCNPLGDACKGKVNPAGCKRWRPPKTGWPLIILALVHPTSLNAALSALPFKVYVRNYL